MSDRPFVGSSNNPRDAGFNEIAIAFSEKSRRRKSSMIVDQRTSGRVPGRTGVGQTQHGRQPVRGHDQVRLRRRLGQPDVQVEGERRLTRDQFGHLG